MHNLHKYDDKKILFPNSFHGTKMGSVGVVNQILGSPGGDSTLIHNWITAVCKLDHSLMDPKTDKNCWCI